LSVVSRRSASRMHSKYFLWETVPSNFHFSLFSFILVVTASTVSIFSHPIFAIVWTSLRCGSDNHPFHHKGEVRILEGRPQGLCDPRTQYKINYKGKKEQVYTHTKYSKRNHRYTIPTIYQQD
jgi:hypothetical protein